MRIDREKIKNMFGGKCAYCGSTLGDKWHVDHVEPVRRQSGDIKRQSDGTYKVVTTAKMSRPENHNDGNLFPACVSCNIHKSASTVEGFRRVLRRHIESLNEATNYSIYRHAKRFGLVTETEAPIIFWFETYSKEKGQENE